MASVTFGRVGLATASGGDGMVLDTLEDAGWEGDTIAIEGKATAATLADAKALRDQLLGYHLNSDEPVIPFTWTEDPTVDGFYRVQSVSAGVVGQGSYLAGGIGFEWEAELLKVPGWQAPLFEIVSSGAHRGGGSVATGDPWLGVPYTAGVTTPYALASGTNPGTTTVVGDNGTALILYTAADQLYDDSVRFYCETSIFYKVACGIEVTADSGTTWRTLVGSQVPADSDGWRLTNHITRVSVVGNDLRVEKYDGAAWEATDFTPTRGAGGSSPIIADGLSGPTVIRNSPECSSVMLTSSLMRTMTLSVRRGGTLIEGWLTSGSTGDAKVYGIYRDASEAATAITGGIEATAADVNGNKFIILSPNAITKDVTGTSGIELSSSGTAFRFAIGVSNDDLATGNVTAIEEYFAANNVRQLIVAR